MKKFVPVIIIFILAFSLIVYLFFQTVIEHENISAAYTAFGTLALALVTGLLAFFTFLHVKSNVDKERRDRKENLLNEIIEWAESIFKCWYETDIFIIKGKNRIISIDSYRSYLFTNQIKNIYFTIVVSKISGSSPELMEALNRLKSNLDEHIKLIVKWRASLNEPDELTDEYEKNAADHVSKFKDSITKVIEEATKLKTENLK